MKDKIRTVFIRYSDNRIKFIWKFLILIIVGLILSKLVGTALAVLLKIYYEITRGQVIQYNEFITNPITKIFTLFIEQILMISIIFFCINKVDKMKLEDFYVSFNIKNCLQFFVGFIISTASIWLVIKLFDNAGLIEKFTYIKFEEFCSSKVLYLMVTYETILLLLLSFKQELLYRAYMIEDIYKEHKNPIIIGTSLAFMLISVHNPATQQSILNILLGDNGAINIILLLIFCVNIFFLGLLLCQCFLKTQKFGIIFGINFGWNFVQAIVFGLKINGTQFPQTIGSMTLNNDIKNVIFTGGEVMGPQAGLFVTLGLILMNIILILVVKKDQKIFKD